MAEIITHKIVLVVSNVKNLQPGMEVKKTFDMDGGIIGSELTADWFLQDDSRSISPNHCQILMLDGDFCLKDLSGNTFINDSDMPIGFNRDSKLQHKDEIKIGDYHIKIYLNLDEGFEDAHRPLDEFFTDGRVELLEDIEGFKLATFPDKDKTMVCDPLLALDQSSNRYVNQNSKDHELTQILEKPVQKESQTQTFQSDSDFELTSSMHLKQSKSQSPQIHSDNHLIDPITKIENQTMDEKTLELLEKELEQGSQPMHTLQVTNGNEHLVMGPIFDGLNASINTQYDIEKVHKLGEEIGATLRVCIERILEINQQMNNSRFGVVNKNLQPIEDNPLRLSLSYTETLDTLFGGNKSVVQLSAPAAVEESLKNLKNHNQATQEAISETLNQVLLAFSPQVLLKRFNKYKSSDQKINEQDQNSWAWEMYQQYFNELASNRQTGFDKLFWEIFEHSYDQKIRDMHKEDL